MAWSLRVVTWRSLEVTVGQLVVTDAATTGDREVKISFPIWTYFSLLSRDPTSSGRHSASWPMSAGISFPNGEAAKTFS